MRLKCLTLIVSLFTFYTAGYGGDCEDEYFARKDRGAHRYLQKLQKKEKIRERKERKKQKHSGYFSQQPVSSLDGSADDKSLPTSTPGCSNVSTSDEHDSSDFADDESSLGGSDATSDFEFDRNEPCIRVLPVKLPVERTGRGKGSKIFKGPTDYDPLDISITFPDGSVINVGKYGGLFPLQPLDTNSNRSFYGLGLVIQDQSETHSLIYNKARRQALPHVKLSIIDRVRIPTLRIFYDKKSKSFCAEGAAPRNWWLPNDDD